MTAVPITLHQLPNMNEQSYVGARKVVGVSELESKTPAGSSMVHIIFEDGSTQDTTLVRFNLIKSTEPSDATAVGQIVRKIVGSMIYSILHEYDISMAETTPVMDETVALINAGSAKATNILFGVDYPDDRTLLQINDILLKYVENTTDKNNNESAPEGGTTD